MPRLALALLVPALLAAGPTGMVAVPAGRLIMGSDDGEGDERPGHPVRVSAFLLDRTEVTVGSYRRCVQAGRCAAPRRPQDDDRLPVTWVSWRDAVRYCRFAGKRLPTEAEWERAARGDDGRTYPWGDQPDCARANFGNYRDEGRCPHNPGRPEIVGQRPAGASPFGALDLAGNVWEWVADRYRADYYAASPPDDPRGPDSGPTRVVRGDGCCSMFGLPRATNRLAFPEDYADEDLGFRCAL
jgi:formylglycine-generating enzyme required for sulfatase activity